MSNFKFVDAALTEDLVFDIHPPANRQNLAQMLNLISEFRPTRDLQRITLAKILFFFMQGYISTFQSCAGKKAEELFEQFCNLWYSLDCGVCTKHVGRMKFSYSYHGQLSKPFPESSVSKVDLLSYLGLLLEQLVGKLEVEDRMLSKQASRFQELWKKHCQECPDAVTQARDFRVQYFFD
jgi:hypothetical protein